MSSIPQTRTKTSSSKKNHKGIVIEVTGTKFYTTTSSCSDLLEIALEEGSIKVKMCNKNQKEILSLKEGDYLEIAHDLTSVKSTIEEHGNPMKKAMSNFLKFKDTKLSEIIKRLSAVHNCSFSIINPEIANHLLTADLTNNTLEDILSIFEVTMGVHSSINKNNIIELN